VPSLLRSLLAHGQASKQARGSRLDQPVHSLFSSSPFFSFPILVSFVEFVLQF
jgi:hypothetical protein